TGRHRVGVDHVLDRVAPVAGIGGFKGARGTEGALAGPWPRVQKQAKVVAGSGEHGGVTCLRARKFSVIPADRNRFDDRSSVLAESSSLEQMTSKTEAVLLSRSSGSSDPLLVEWGFRI